MRSGLLAFALASAFVGAAFYINIVEQPARLALNAAAMIREWSLSNRRGFVLLSVFAIMSAALAYIDFGRTGDVRWIIGGTVILANWPYAYFVIVPVNVWLCSIPPNAAGSAARDLMRDWGLVEWGQTAIGFAACCLFAWTIVWPT